MSYSVIVLLAAVSAVVDDTSMVDVVSGSMQVLQPLLVKKLQLDVAGINRPYLPLCP